MSTRIPSQPRAHVEGPPGRAAPPASRWASGLLARLGHPEVAQAAEKERRAIETGFVGELLVGRIDPPLRLSPRQRREAGAKAHEVGSAVRYAHLWAHDSVAYLFTAEMAAGDLTRWQAAVGGVGLHRYLRWCDERAHFEDASAWASDLRAGCGTVLSDLYEVALHEDPAILGGIAARMGLPAPSPTRSLWDIAYPPATGAARAAPG